MIQNIRQNLQKLLKSFAEVYTDKNQEVATKSVLALMDDMESESKDNDIPNEEKGLKRLARIFKRKQQLRTLTISIIYAIISM